LSSFPPERARSVPKTASVAGRAAYTVRSGDTLGTIADAHGIGLSTLRRLNGMGSRTTRIHPGQKLVVSEAPETVEVADASESTAYRIRRGDTLTTIARRFGVSVEELRRWNQIDSDRIVVGQSITIRGNGGHQPKALASGMRGESRDGWRKSDNPFGTRRWARGSLRDPGHPQSSLDTLLKF
jgi:LysM repeat protein